MKAKSIARTRTIQLPIVRDFDTAGGWIEVFKFSAADRGKLRAVMPLNVAPADANALIDRVASAYALWKLARDPVSPKVRRAQLALMLRNTHAVRAGLAKIAADEHFADEFLTLVAEYLIAVRHERNSDSATAFSLLQVDPKSPQILNPLHTLPRAIDAALWLLESALARAPAHVDVKRGQSTEHLDALVLRIAKAFEEICKRPATHSRGSQFRVFAAGVDDVLKVGAGAETIRRVLAHR